MNNFTIIINEAINRNIYTEEQIKHMIENNIDIGLHTYKEWQKFGYQVKRGEKALFDCKIWRHKNQDVKEISEEEISEDVGYYLAKAYFFHIKQVEQNSN